MNITILLRHKLFGMQSVLIVEAQAAIFRQQISKETEYYYAWKWAASFVTNPHSDALRFCHGLASLLRTIHGLFFKCMVTTNGAKSSP